MFSMIMNARVSAAVLRSSIVKGLRSCAVQHKARAAEHVLEDEVLPNDLRACSDRSGKHSLRNVSRSKFCISLAHEGLARQTEQH